MALLTGTRFGSYEILSLIGVGGMGEVYRARDLQLNREVAVKVLLNLSTDTHRLHRFEQEAQAAAALNHPNILAVYFMGRYEGAPYLVSELLSGEPLRQTIKRGPLPVRKVIDYGVQIAHGLEAAHEKGIVHRDLKPENLFITREGRVKILDFGLAKLTQPLQSAEYGVATVSFATEPGVVMGTVGYMSPEQVRGESSDHRTDIFAFGVVLFEMLSGKRAFQRNTAAESMAAILREEPANIQDLVPNLPLGLQRIVHRCLEKSPEQRFQSAADLAFALESAGEISVSRQLPVMAEPPPAKRKMWLIPILVVALAAPVAVFFLWPKIRPMVIVAPPKVEQSSPAAVAQPPEPKASSSEIVIPHELKIVDAATYPWFDPQTKKPLVWYSPAPDGTLRFFDGPGVDPQTGQNLSQVTPELVANLTPPPAPQPVPKKQKEPKSTAPKTKQVSDSHATTDHLREDAELEAQSQKAQTAMNAGDYQTALEICTKVLNASAGSQPCTAIRQHAAIKLAEQYVNEGNEYWEKGDFDKALSSAEKAIDLDPANHHAARLKRLAEQMKGTTAH